MARVRSKDTEPERIVRRSLTKLGYRYRLHRSDLPGKPDIAFIGRKKAIFVNGCFWHGHGCKRGARVPTANREYWIAKIGRNTARDIVTQIRISEIGWRSLVLFECELKNTTALAATLRAFLEG